MLPTIGQRFEIRYTSQWEAVCPHCGRWQARTRRYKGQEPCRVHRRITGLELSRYAAIVTDVRPGGMSYRTTARLSVYNPPIGTDGRVVDTGGMSDDGWTRALAEGEVVLLDDAK